MITEAKWSVRAMLGLLALVAGFCGIIAWQTGQIVREQRAIRERLKVLEDNQILTGSARVPQPSHWSDS